MRLAGDSCMSIELPETIDGDQLDMHLKEWRLLGLNRIARSDNYIIIFNRAWFPDGAGQPCFCYYESCGDFWARVGGWMWEDAHDDDFRNPCCWFGPSRPDCPDELKDLCAGFAREDREEYDE